MAELTVVHYEDLTYRPADGEHFEIQRRYLFDLLTFGPHEYRHLEVVWRRLRDELLVPAGVTLERGAVFRAMPTANGLEVYAEVEVELFKKWHVRFRELTWELPELSGPRRADEST
ncbi:MAG: hypothetical protein AAGI01_18745 [Myxococcota bacterium]